MPTTQHCPICGAAVEQTGLGRPRRFCSPEHREQFWNAAKAKGLRGEDHRMTDVNPDTQTGTCSQCGPNTRAYRSSRGSGVRWRCRNRVRSQESVQNPARVRDLEGAARSKMQLGKMRARGVVITLEEWEALKVRADGHCQLCGREAPLHVDHCHDTGRVRGLLCSTCNTGLGKFGDDPVALRRAAEYLERNGSTVA